MSSPPSSIIDLKSFQVEKAEWLRFARVLLLILGAPLVIAFLLCEFLCWESGELISDQVAAQRQIADPHLEWLAHRDVDAVRYKLIRVAQERPDVLVMGQSRMGQFRAAMFQPYSFYNLCRVSWPINTLSEIVRHLPLNYSPKVIIFNLDFFMFHSGYSAEFANAAPRFQAPAWQVHLFSLRDALSDLSANPLDLVHGGALFTMGLHATLFHHGFRRDGSLVWAARAAKVPAPDPNLLAETKWNYDALTYGNSMDGGAETDLEEFAKAARERGIRLIGIQLPMYGPVVQEIEKSSHFGILRDFRAHIASGYFSGLGIIMFDYLDFPPYGYDARYWGDQFHPTEPISAAILLKIAKDPRVRALLPKLDTAALERSLEKDRKADQHFYLYGR